MKKNTHPTYYPQAPVKCACGNTFKVGSTKSELNVEICSNCHPFYTGEAKVIDTAGRVERFKKIMEKSAAKKVTKKHPVKSNERD